jgi:peroxiredoxin
MTRSLLLLMLLLPFVSRGQDARKILKTAFAKCESIKNAYYRSEATNQHLYSDDTLHNVSEVAFRRLPKDTIYGNKFHSRIFFQGEYMEDKLFTGSHLVTYRTTDSSGTIYPAELYGGHIKSMLGGGQLYAMFDQDFKQRFPTNEDASTLGYLGFEKVGSYTCYHFRHSHQYNTNPSNNPQVSQIIIDLWVNRADSFPIKYSIRYAYITTKDTLHSFSEETLTSYELNRLRDSRLLTMSSIPAYCRLSEYSPAEPQKLLAPGSQAPAWSLVTTGGRTLKLEDLRGRVVLLDFFYKSCLPCGAAIPTLVGLDRQYREKGFSVVGMDSFDKNDQSLKNYIKSKEMTYPIVLGGEDADKLYHVSSYPTMYLIDRQGKILFSSVGFTERDRDNLQALIERNL